MKFRTRLFLIMVAVTALIQAVTMAVVNNRFQTNVATAVGTEFEYAHLRLSRFLTLSLDNLITLTTNISQDPRLRGSIATNDPQTIRHAVNETFQSYGTDLFWLMSPTGDVLVRAEDSISQDNNLRDISVVKDARNGYDSGDIWLYKGKLYQVAVVQVRSADIPVGLLLVGEEFDSHFTQRFASLTGLDLAFIRDGDLLSYSRPPATRNSFLSATSALLATKAFAGKPLPDIPILPQQPDSLSAPFLLFETADEPHAGALFRLSDISHRSLARGIIFRSLAVENERLRRIQESLLIVGLLAILVAFIAAYFVSQRISRPLRRLAEASERLGKGDLESAIRPEGSGEIGALASELEQMRVSLKKAREELIQSERLSTIGRLASTIAHDFRQPLTAIYGFLELLTMPNAKEEHKLSYKEAVFKQFNRMLGMINELLDFARGEIKLKLQPIRLSDFIEEVTQGFERQCEQSGVILEKHIEWDGVLTIDVERLQRGLENIIKNAVQILPPGGRVTVNTTKDDEMARISISDTGPGIPQEILATIFEPFVTHGKVGGTGLGLAVARRVVLQHNGDITVTSQVGYGATFHITLPVEKSEDFIG